MDNKNRENMLEIALSEPQISRSAYSIGIDILLRGVRPESILVDIMVRFFSDAIVSERSY